MLKTIIDKLKSAFSEVHTWDAADRYSMHRTCTVCGQREELDLGSGHAGSSWEVVHAGDMAKHQGAPK